MSHPTLRLDEGATAILGSFLVEGLARRLSVSRPASNNFVRLCLYCNLASLALYSPGLSSSVRMIQSSKSLKVRLLTLALLGS
eukprot:192265-Amphidinium_carterae.1